VASGISLGRDDFSENAQLPSEFILGASRFIDYKKLDKVINIGEWLNLPVVIAGSGPLLDQLREQAAQSSTQVTIIESPSDILLLELYSRCLAYVFPGVEDFGVMPLEASAAGAPVLANHIGGTSETILEGANGAIVDMQSKSEILSGFSRLQNLDRSKGLNHISKFDTSVFKKEFSAWVLSN
jgi:glycosyltransferase involved in cell wall biosynthesis